MPYLIPYPCHLDHIQNDQANKNFFNSLCIFLFKIDRYNNIK